jgi:hypothetical protein
MAKGWKGRKASSFKRVSGAQAGRVAVKVYVCRSCGLQHPPGRKPEQCMDRSCGGLAFTVFDSTGEAGRWATLLLMEGQGIISNLKRQVSFDLMAATSLGDRTVGAKVARYVADFTYTRDGEDVIEDWKGGMTDVAALKLKWMAAMGKPVKLTGA